MRLTLIAPILLPTQELVRVLRVASKKLSSLRSDFPPTHKHVWSIDLEVSKIMKKLLVIVLVMIPTCIGIRIASSSKTPKGTVQTEQQRQQRRQQKQEQSRTVRLSALRYASPPGLKLTFASSMAVMVLLLKAQCGFISGWRAQGSWIASRFAGRQVLNRSSRTCR